MNYKISISFCLLLISILIELIITLFFNKIGLNKTSSILYFFAGILIAFIILIKKNQNAIQTKKLNKNIIYLIFTIIIVFFCVKLNLIFKSHPINYRYADMLSILKVMSQRFLKGEAVYTPIQEIWNGMQPIYLPAMFLPYCFAEIFNFDMRWVSVVVLLLSFFLIIKSIKDSNLFHLILLFCLGFFLIEILHHENYFWFVLTEEPLVYGYYILLGLALFHKNIYAISITIVLCLLSRYILLFWIPVFLLFWYHQENKKQAIQMSIIIVLLTFGLMSISGAIFNLPVFLKTPNGYLKAIQSGQQNEYLVDIISNSLGVAKFFKFNNLHYLHYISMITIIILPFILLLFYNKFTNFFNKKMFLLGVLKLVLVMFYNLLIVPYDYLFTTSTLFSFILLFTYMTKENVKNEAAN